MISVLALGIAKSGILFLTRFARVISKKGDVCNLVAECGQEVLSFPVEIDQ
jgi:hypothetical protein